MLRAASPRTEYMTLRTDRDSQQLALASNGQITGPTLQLLPTQTGYRGMADSMMVDLRSDGERIVGTIRDQIVDLHVSVVDANLVARGLFAGRLGHIDASSAALKSNLGRCSYELRAAGQRYEGQRACGRTNIPMARPVVIELPAGIERLSVDRQAMLLAILLSQ
jgi:hypothetical protein